MESANSGSLHSSSGDDDEFDSRVSAFFRSSSSSSPIFPPPPVLSTSSDSHHFFDYPSLTYFDSSTPLLPLDSTAAGPPFPRPRPIPSSSNCTAAAAGSQSSSSSSVQPPHQPVVTPRGSKKRSRASRRAPTTVLTTDASNFRAMVQEFTGIPSPPFASASASASSSSPFARSYISRFHSPPAAGAAPPPPFLLRPFPQKARSPTPSPASNLVPRLSITDTSNTATETNNFQYLLPPHDSSQAASRSSQSLISPVLNFQTLLQPSLLQAKYTIPTTSTGFNEKLHILPLAAELIGAEAMRSTWMGGAADADPAQLRHVMDSSLKQTHSASGRTELEEEKPSASPGSLAATRGKGMMDSWIHSPE
ncbi:hypothetical protein Cni_G15149 [Canna indica]|uniref:VQ domain-containing protein n=1 Tax=Canna indica TaxID=4628 RepID=A0AAQ3KDA3_9LILI|nr:hypothetical protein Cni_G15149 [Canna indica]